MTKINNLIEKAQNQREDGMFAAALDTCNAALLLSGNNKNRERSVQCLVDRAIVFRHLFEQNNDMLFAILVRKDAETILEMVKIWGVSERLHTAYYMLGQAALLFQDYVSAEKWFFKSLRYFKGNLTEKGSWRYHWAKALYLIGEKKRALLAFSQSFMEINKNSGKVDNFLQNVYLSGAYCNFAQVLAKDDLKEARKYLQLGKEIIHKDKRLVVRKRQLKELEKYFAKVRKQLDA